MRLKLSPGEIPPFDEKMQWSLKFDRKFCSSTGLIEEAQGADANTDLKTKCTEFKSSKFSYRYWID